MSEKEYEKVEKGFSVEGSRERSLALICFFSTCSLLLHDVDFKKFNYGTKPFNLASYRLGTQEVTCKFLYTVFPRFDPFYIVNYFMKWVKTSWTCSSNLLFMDNVQDTFYIS